VADIRIDTSALTYKNFLILGQTATPVDGSTGAVLSLSPGTYTFQQPDIDSDFLFEITSEGFVTYTPAHDSFLSGRGTSTLVVRGLSITLDATLLSHNLLPTVRESSYLLRDRTHEMHLLPASSYGFYVERGILADFLFGVDANGQVIVDSRFAGFAQADGRTLKILGYRLTLDGRALSHDLKPIVIESFLPRDRTHELTLIPAFRYTFQPAAGIVADFFFDVDVSGQIVIDPRYGGFATVSGRSLTINGYQITIDGQQLSHDLAVSIFAPNQNILLRDRTHELTLIPAVGYSFVSAPGIAADFQFALNVDGQVVVDPRYGGFATASGRMLTISGYQVTIDGQELPYDLSPSLLGNQNVLLRDRVHKLTLIPASAYVLMASGNPEILFRITLDTNGKVGILDVSGGLNLIGSVPPPTLRSFYAGFFLPVRGSLREFCKPTQEISLRQAIRDHRELFFNGFSPLRDIERRFSGGTSEEEEDEALAILLSCSRADDLIDLVNKLTWDRLDDELDESDLTRIMDRLQVLLDRRDYLVGFLLRWFFLVENERLPNIDFQNVLEPFSASRTAEVRHSFAEQSLNQRDTVLDGIAHMALRELPTYAREFKLVLDRAAGSEQYRAPELQRLSWEVFYTDLICTQLARGEYRLLQQTLIDLFNPGSQQFPFPERNVALFNMLRRWDRHFVAMERLISVLGSERQKADVRRYMETRKLFMDNFPVQQQPPAQPTGFLAAIQQAIQSITTTLTGVAGTFQDLVGSVQAIVTVIENIGKDQLLGNIEDDEARAAVNTMSSVNLLTLLPALYKSELINRMLDGPTLDEDEDAILTILRETKTRSPAEFLQLTASATWEALDTDFNGEQYDQLEALFRF
jgi:hypothetical protein